MPAHREITGWLNTLIRVMDWLRVVVVWHREAVIHRDWRRILVGNHGEPKLRKLIGHQGRREAHITMLII